MNVDEVDPLDAFMARLELPQATAGDGAARAPPPVERIDWSTAARRWPSAAAQAMSSAVVKNRRYRRLQQLLAGAKAVPDPSQPESKEANADDWYFSDTMMQQRNPALFHFHLGQYLPSSSSANGGDCIRDPAHASGSSAALGPEELLLSSFLLSTNDRREMEARRALEQRTWGKFTGHDVDAAAQREKDLFEEGDEEEEEDSSSDEEEKRDPDDETNTADADVSAAAMHERRQHLVELMAQRFLHGLDGEYVDYAAIDGDEALDDLDQMQRDAEDAGGAVFFVLLDTNLQTTLCAGFSSSWSLVALSPLGRTVVVTAVFDTIHRAEKSSSRICRNREVERAQDLHRKKLDSVKSYLAGVTRPPAAVKPLALFRRKPHPSNPRGEGERNAEEQCADDDEAGDGADPDEEDDSGGVLTTSTLSRASMDDSPLDDRDADGTASSSQQSLAKLDDFRSAAPVALKSCSPHHRRLVHLPHASPGKASPPALPGSKGKSLHGAFRLHRLKEIRADNVGILERIKESAAHYRNDALQRSWAQNVSYLASICEFPVALESLAAAPSPRHAPVQPHPFGGVFSGPRGRMDTPESLLPSIHQHPQPVVVHPIRAVPTSPRRLQLNLSPAFRSLRKGMPQQPALPPITNAAHSSGHGSTACLNAVAAYTGAGNGVASMTDFGFYAGGTDDGDDGDKHDGSAFIDSDMLGLLGSPFIGDLGSSSGGSSTSRLLHVDTSASLSALEDATKYRLLKLGRFVGGSYLVLTVFCGDGTTNPYGFDVLAVHQKSNREFTLRMTKAMTHELLETVSSSSQAAATAAAAGTNWPVEDIARRICDRISFTTFEGGMGEMAFLVSNIGGTHDKALLLDSTPATLAFCIHQCAQLTAASSSSSSDSAAAIPESGASTASKRRLHVFASTRRAQNGNTTCVADTVFEKTARQRGDGSSLAICFQMHDDAAKKQRSSSAPTTAAGDLEVEIAVHELYEIVQKTMSIDGMSLERIVVAAVRHLHIARVPRCEESIPTADDEDTFKEVLIVNHHVNTLLVPIASPLASTTKQTKALKPKTSRVKHLLSRGATSPLSSASLVSLRTASSIPLLESGMIWKHAHLLARVWFIEPKGDDDEEDDEEFEENSVLSSQTLLPRKKPPEFIQDTDGTLVVHIFNPLSKSYSERSFSPEQVDMMIGKLAALAPIEGSDRCAVDFQETRPFVKLVLARLQVDVDLFGVEVLTFPGLDAKTERGSPTQSSARRVLRTHCGQLETTEVDALLPFPHDAEKSAEERRGAAAVAIQAHVRGFLFRKQYYDDDDDEHCSDEATDLSTEMQFQSDRCSVSEDGAMPENDELERRLQGEDEPCELAFARRASRLRRGQKIGGAFCLVQLPVPRSSSSSSERQPAVVLQLGRQLSLMTHEL